ncbi:MAG: hypothetical protein GF309_11285 [Candidatus Lokiarchaeota archaeon]|nr:hypothetical protein [Candidatus Lokiarchaeota archaeon]
MSPNSALFRLFTSRLFRRTPSSVKQVLVKFLKMHTACQGSFPLRKTSIQLASNIPKSVRKKADTLLAFDVSIKSKVRFQYVFKDENTAVVEEAESLMDGKYNLLSRQFNFPERPIWNAMVDGESTYPNHYYKHLAIYDPNFADYKFTWELNRFQFLLNLAKASWLTGEMKYLKKGQETISQWIKENPCPFTVNWYSSMEVAIRSLSWMLFYMLMKKIGTSNIHWEVTFFRSLQAHGHFLNNNLTIENQSAPRWRRNNHSIVELSILCIVLWFLDMSDCSRLERLIRYLHDDLEYQYRSDGISAEQSIAYMRVNLEAMYLFYRVFTEKTERYLPQLPSVCRRQVEFLKSMANSSGLVPRIGDDDGGTILPRDLSYSFWDYSGIIDLWDSLQAEKRSFHHAAEFPIRPVNFWFNGILHSASSSKKPDYTRRKKIRHRIFPESGYLILESKTYRCIFRCGPMGFQAPMEYCPHAHADSLSILLWKNGFPVLVDSGTFSYWMPQNASFRNYFRSEHAHNTLVLENSPHAVFYGPFGAKSLPEKAIISYESGQATGILHLKDGAKLRRTIQFSQSSVLISDSVQDSRKKQVLRPFIMNPKIRPVREKDGCTLYLNDEIFVRVYTGSRIRFCLVPFSRLYGSLQFTTAMLILDDIQTINRSCILMELGE